MEWERAKSFLLLFFILLNLTLGFLIINERRRYTVTPEREQAIMTIMAENNITMDTRIIRRFPPMRELIVSGFYYDVDELLDIFFDTPANVMRSYFPHGQDFFYEDAELEIFHGFVSYNNLYGHGGAAEYMVELNRTRAEELTNAFVQAYFPDFRLDDVFESGSRIRLSYRQVYRGYIIHTNFIEFTVTEMGIVRVDMQFSQVLEFGHEGPIAAPDEALLTFVRRVRDIALVSPIVITHMDLVYFQVEESFDPDASNRAVPFYRIFIDGGGIDSDPFLINAITNEVLN